MIATSYFYQVRFFKPNMIPLSTAKWDPKWFHNFRGPGHTFVDKNGVVNGLRAEPFAPDPSCDNLCRGPQNCDNKSPVYCPFMQRYAKQLDTIPIGEIMERCYRLGVKVKELTHFEGEPAFVFLVHEAPDNPCSERVIIQRYFTDHGIPCKELNPKATI